MDRRLFRAALAEAGVKNVEDYLEWAQERGGYCDYEVLLNAMRGFNEIRYREKTGE